MAENYPMKSDGKKGVQDSQVAVVMVPLPAQGHLNQLLHLSRLISLYNIPVHYVGATTHIRQAKFPVHVEDVPAIPNAECYCFNSISAFHVYSLFWEMKGKPFQAGTQLYEDIPSLESCCTKEIWELWRKQESLMGKVSSGELYYSS
ncbi:hypothetical protein MTR67_046153 [Solanum verrucosum]|uniref:Glycosyltransferase N-terminal domain-containing protein n=1 Tax=Solanum verrucosum TaxID=315347 RepID=A0AAF0UWU6_SOLVR|nr:hypothetical protein MTR67_046153 [Solanum verrucosum]